MEEECAAVLSSFFSQMREREKEIKLKPNKPAEE